MDAEVRGRELAQTITGSLARRYSTATVLLHHAIAERLGLGPTDLKCLDLVVARGSMTGSQLAAVTGLTTGAMSGVIARLARAGYVSREVDPLDRRMQVIRPVADRVQEAHQVFASLRPTSEGLLEGFDTPELEVIAEFLGRLVEFNQDRAATLRARLLAEGRPTRRTSSTAPDTTRKGTT